MNRAELEKDMMHRIGAFPTVNQVREYMGWGKDKNRELLKGLPKISNRVFYKDVVDRIMGEMEHDEQSGSEVCQGR